MATTREQWIERKRVRSWASPRYGERWSSIRCPVCNLRLHLLAVEIGDLVHITCDPTGEILALVRRRALTVVDGGGTM